MLLVRNNLEVKIVEDVIIFTCVVVLQSTAHIVIPSKVCVMFTSVNSHCE